jgi:hypothetical protein
MRAMAFILRRVLISLLIPFAWRKWRERSRRTTTPGTQAV